MKILVLNIGSSSVKYDLFDNEESILKGNIEKIGGDSSHSMDGDVSSVKIKTVNEALRLIITILDRKGLKVDAVGHRVVHGGEIEKPSRITPALISKLKQVTELAPLHNGPEIRGIESCSKLFNAPQVAVFDTAFHQTMPEYAYTYAIPYDLTKKHNIRRYGFHGTNHKYVAEEACRTLKKKIKQSNIITCHLGNGCSITAVHKGRSIDTSMGFTPLEGVVMGTRSGSIDPAILTFLMDHDLYATDEINDLLNYKSGLLGISGKSNDIRDLIKDKSPRSKLALDIFCYSIIKQIGSYAAAMNGVDTLVFTGGIGENAYILREKILKSLGYLGIKADKKRNRSNGPVISEKDSKVAVCVIPANEALMIAREVLGVLKK